MRHWCSLLLINELLYVKPVASILGIPHENIFANQLLFGSNGEFMGFDKNEPTSRSGGKAVAVQQLRKVQSLRLVRHPVDFSYTSFDSGWFCRLVDTRHWSWPGTVQLILRWEETFDPPFSFSSEMFYSRQSWLPVTS